MPSRIPGANRSGIPGNAKIPGTPPKARSLMPAPANILTGGRDGLGRLQDVQGRFVQGGVGVAWHGFEASGAYLEKVAKKAGEEGPREAMERVARMAEDKMKIDGPWEDRTGEARDGLTAIVLEREPGVFELHLGHTAPHGIHLEFGMGGRFQVVYPTMRWAADQLGPAVERDMGKL